MFYDFIYTNKNTNNTQKYPLFLSNKLFFRFLFLVERKILIFDLLTMIGGSGGIRFDDGLDLPIGKLTGGSGGIRFRILSFVSSLKILTNYL